MELTYEELKRQYDDLSDNYSILQEKFVNALKETNKCANCLYKMFTDKKEEKMPEEFYVFNPRGGKPNVVHNDYQTALEECKRIAESSDASVLVLKVVAKAEVQKLINVTERTQNG